ncbi:MAG: hypothetical protein HN580_28170 [Deltaproteobacteria bacterium]|jgi:hypothetical protein|nr:hypothetical protein [Deltaproteobacteria bacterium]MBT4642091.1 hypothetical protein [Deltaproteobacteria bacterium]MBT6499104.1 hypothetical protein [Deltaproteobacteria bacterium]MBT6614982.1 hypothetical protein [Deltaproteobacteria bacterium]MBT7155303.1 hypothetical protein [Deltaproteobacteria bacterium]
MVLKKMMKAALAASLVFCFASVGAAETKVGGQVQTHWGQYNAGTDGYSAYFRNYTQGHVNVTSSAGPLSVFLQMEIVDDDGSKKEVSVDADQDGTNETYAVGGGANKNNYKNAQARATYTSGDLKVSLGTVSNWMSCGFTNNGGMGNNKPATEWQNCSNYTEEDGIQVKYGIPAMKGYAALTLQNSDSYMKTSLTTVLQVVDGIKIMANQLSRADKAAADGTTGDKYSGLLLGVKAAFGKMAVAFDNYAGKYSDSENGSNQMGVMFSMADLGPGKMILTYGTVEKLTGGTASKKDVYTNLVYAIPVEKRATVRAFYTSKAGTPTGGDTTTATYMGGGLELKF